MTVAAILKHKGYDIIKIAPTDEIAEVAQVLSDHRIGAVLVMDRADQLLGIVSERDVVRSLSANGAGTLRMTAGQLMTRVLHTVTPDTSVIEAMHVMTNSRVRHLPVMKDGVLIGMISIGDVVKARITAQAQEVESLRAYVAGAT